LVTSKKSSNWERYESMVLRLAPSIVRGLGIDPSSMSFKSHAGRRGAYNADHEIDVLGTGSECDVYLECKAYERPLERKDVYAIRGQYQSAVSLAPGRRAALVVICQSGVRASVLSHLRDDEELLYRKSHGPIHLVTIPPLFLSVALPAVEFVSPEHLRLFVVGDSDPRSVEELVVAMDRSIRFADRITLGSQLLTREMSSYDRGLVTLSVSDALLHLGQPVVSKALAESVLSSTSNSTAQGKLKREAIVRVASAEFQRAVKATRGRNPRVGKRAVALLNDVRGELRPSEGLGAELFLASWHARQASGSERARHHMRAAARLLDGRDGPDREYGDFLYALRDWEQRSPAERADRLPTLEAAQARLGHPHHAAIGAMILSRARSGTDVSIWTAFSDEEINNDDSRR